MRLTDAPVSGQTRLAAVIGDPVRHSLSPAIHNAAFAALGLDWVYVAFDVPSSEGGRAIEAMRVLGIDGLSVTMPHKQAVAESVDRRSDAVEALGACNCVYRDGGELVGDNTDGEGFVRSLEATVPASERTGLYAADIVILGAGGAARSIAHALSVQPGAGRVVVVNRSRAAAERAAELGANIEAVDLADVGEAVGGARLVVNATSVGMGTGPAPDELPIPASLLSDRHVVADIVYQPRMTPLLLAAAAAGAQTVGGLGMLVHQAATAFQHWTGVTAPIDVMEAAVR